MPSLAYVRRDWPVVVRATEGGGVSLRFDGPGADVALTRGEVTAWARGPGRGRVPRLVRALIADAMTTGALGPLGPVRDNAVVLPRLALNTDDATVGLPWEAMFLAADRTTSFAISRVSPVPPSGVGLPLSLPARLLQVGRARPSLAQMIVGWRALNHSLDDFEVRAVLRVDGVDTDIVDDWRRDEAWPTIDLLHLEVPEMRGDRLSTAHPDEPGTLGWLRRLLSTAGTRVLVLGGPSHLAEDARRLAAAVVAGGGPAVVVAPANSPLDILYAHVIHDRPLDAAALIAHDSGTVGRGLSVFGGAGREELLRFSQVADEFAAVAETARAEDRLDLADAIEYHVTRRMGEWEFENQERRGVLPMGAAVEEMRASLGVRRAGAARADPSPAPRFVNSAFLATDGEGRPAAALDQPMTVGQSYVLAVDIGPQSATPSLRATALLEEVMKWAPGDEGRFVEVGVTRLDFDVAGASVQELWVPRDAPSDAVYFSVTPGRSGAAAVRFSVFVDQTVVQSFRVGAVTGDAAEKPDAALLARLLGVERDEVGDAVWRSRMEFTMSGAGSGFLDEPEAALSIVANHREGEAVVTVKGADVFNVTTSTDLARMVRDVRAALSDTATPPIRGVRPDQLPYAFATDDDHLNEGDDTMLGAALQRMAAVGWRLFDHVFAGADRARLAQALAQPDSVIRVAHVLLEKVVPWAALYTREYDADRTKIGSVAVQHTACLAAVPDAAGVMPDMACGTSPACKLHPGNLPAGIGRQHVERYASVVACPRHVLGFRHRIELPAGQVDGATSAAGAAGAVPPRVNAATPPRLGVGMHAGLVRHQRHLADLTALVAPAWTAYDADEVKDQLVDDANLDLVYLYCHAEGGIETEIDPPVLRFKPAGGAEGRVRADSLGSAAWPHHPVVIVNGCHTAAFSSDALSPFIRKLTRDREAAGVLGTEISVWEPLATAFALDFVGGLLRAEGAGAAVLGARRRLLAKRNPLGLAYTLYARSDLTLTQ